MFSQGGRLWTITNPATTNVFDIAFGADGHAPAAGKVVLDVCDGG